MSYYFTIITGATSGIGNEIAKKLHQEGHHLILGNRNPEKSNILKDELLELSPNGEVDIIHLDLSSFKSIENFAKEVKKRYDRIDILINNAGLLLKKNLQTEEGFEMTLGVNYLGTYLLTELLLDKLAKSDKPKIIFLSSIVAKYGKCQISENFFKNDKKGFRPYFNSKLALLMYAKELQENNKNLIVKAVHPGIVYTHIWKWKTPVGKYLEKIQKRIMRNVELGAKMPIVLATTSKYDNDNNIYYKLDAPLKLPKQIEDAAFRKKFINYTKELTYNNVTSKNV